MKVTYLVHGINTGDKGLDTVLRLVPYVESHSVIYNNPYGRIGPIGAVWKNKGIAKRLAFRARRAADTTRSIHAVGHSNGCAIVIEAQRRGAGFKSILLINPALKVRTKFPPGDYTVTVIYTEHDRAVRAARFFDAIPFLEVFVPDAWGAMGALGYKGNDPRITSLDWSDILDGHSAIFEYDVMDAIGPILAARIYDV